MNMLNACNETEDTDKRTKCKQIYDHKIILNGKSHKISKKTMAKPNDIFLYQ